MTQWKPIETAPKDQIVDLWADGTRVPDCKFTTVSDGWSMRATDRHKPRWCHWGVIGDDFERGWYSIEEPTHWMPRPAGPQGELSYDPYEND